MGENGTAGRAALAQGCARRSSCGKYGRCAGLQPISGLLLVFLKGFSVLLHACYCKMLHGSHAVEGRHWASRIGV